jgi:ElaB/YqjD/DUF883 family membrane-anchored ribosome-binding protein
MEQTSAPLANERIGLASAAGHLKSGWEHGKNAAEDVKRTAAKSWNDLGEDVDRYVMARPKTVALGALGAGLVLGFLTGALVSRSRRPTSPSAGV